MSDGFWLSDAQWERLRPLLPNKPRGMPRVDDRRVISGIVQALRSGGRWIDVPATYGPRKRLYNRFVRWLVKGVGREFLKLWPRRAGLQPNSSSTARTCRHIAVPQVERGAAQAGDRHQPW